MQSYSRLPITSDRLLTTSMTTWTMTVNGGQAEGQVSTVATEAGSEWGVLGRERVENVDESVPGNCAYFAAVPAEH